MSRRRRRGRGRSRSSAPGPSSTASSGDPIPSSTSSSTTSAQPIPVVPENSSSTRDSNPPAVRQVPAIPPSPPLPIPAPAVPSADSPTHVAAIPPSLPSSIPPAAGLRGNNYASSQKSLADRFYKFLESSWQYKSRLYGTTCMNKMDGTSVPYIVEVCYEDMWKFGAPVDLIMATCNSINNPHVWLLPAAKRFLSDNDCVNESNVKCLYFSGFPESMQMLKDFTTGCPLVQSVHVFDGKTAILAPTVHGRILIEMSMLAILENHSKDVSWGGKFSENDILIIKWHQVNQKTYEMKILPDTMKDVVPKLHEAMVSDMKKVADIFIPLYKNDNNELPVYFAELEQDLKTAEIGFVAEEWFRKYLCYHVSFIHSIGRREFVVLLHNMYTSCNVGNMPIMKARPSIYRPDWRELVISAESDGKLLRDVYYHNNNSAVERIDKYENSVHGLIRLKRNFLEHAGQGRSIRYIADLELCAAQRFDKFLPWLVRTLLKHKQMETRFGDAWNAFMVSRANKSDPWSN